ncbi:MAG: hypothetical protein R2861_10340 [Desulfobacterales bacterium]
MGLTAGYIEYLFPTTEAGGGLGTREVFLDASLSPADGISTGITAYYDFDEVEDYYLNVYMGYGLALDSGLSIDVAASAGYAGDECSGWRGLGFHEYTLSLGMGYAITDMVSGCLPRSVIQTPLTMMCCRKTAADRMSISLAAQVSRWHFNRRCLSAHYSGFLLNPGWPRNQCLKAQKRRYCYDGVTGPLFFVCETTGTVPGSVLNRSGSTKRHPAAIRVFGEPLWLQRISLHLFE